MSTPRGSAAADPWSRCGSMKPMPRVPRRSWGGMGRSIGISAAHPYGPDWKGFDETSRPAADRLGSGADVPVEPVTGADPGRRL